MKAKKTKRKLARPLLLAAAGAATLVLSACGDDSGSSGNLMASPYDASAVADMSQPQDLSKKD